MVKIILQEKQNNMFSYSLDSFLKVLDTVPGGNIYIYIYISLNLILICGLLIYIYLYYNFVLNIYNKDITTISGMYSYYRSIMARYETNVRWTRPNLQRLELLNFYDLGVTGPEGNFRKRLLQDIKSGNFKLYSLLKAYCSYRVEFYNKQRKCFGFKILNLCCENDEEFLAILSTIYESKKSEFIPNRVMCHLYKDMEPSAVIFTDKRMGSMVLKFLLEALRFTKTVKYSFGCCFFKDTTDKTVYETRKERARKILDIVIDLMDGIGTDQNYDNSMDILKYDTYQIGGLHESFKPVILPLNNMSLIEQLLMIVYIDFDGCLTNFLFKFIRKCTNVDHERLFLILICKNFKGVNEPYVKYLLKEHPEAIFNNRYVLILFLNHVYILYNIS